MSAPKGRGRGRGGKGKDKGPLREPEAELISQIRSEHGKASSEQFADSAPIKQEPADVKQSETLSATQKPSRMASEIKAALKEGPKVKGLDPTSKEFTPSDGTKLSDSANGTSSLNPNSAEFVPTSYSTKHQPQQQGGPQSSLNPRTEEFVPAGVLNPQASNFVPKLPLFMQNGGVDESQVPPGATEVPPPLDPADILQGFERVHPEDVAGEPLLKSGAELLVKGTLYPGSYDRLVLNMNTVIETQTPSMETQTNLAEMIVHWGISEPALRYTACRMCQVLCSKMEGFSKPLLRRLQEAGKKRPAEEARTEEERYEFINYTLFFAELFARIRVGQLREPIKVLASALFKFVEQLVSLKEDETIIGACNILKLTGSILETCDGKKMEGLTEKLKVLVKDKTVSSKSTAVVMRVIELQAKKWSTEPVKVSASQISKLNTDAPEFVPSSMVQIQVQQQPVTSAEEWTEYAYLGEDDQLPVDEADGFVPEDYDFDEGLDPEIEQDMEAFIDEIEQHLLMQDFDPELHRDQLGDNK